MATAYLTNNGNLLAIVPTEKDKYAFYSPSGEFLRFVSNDEAEYLKGRLPVKAEIEDHAFEKPAAWRYLWSVTHSDYSRYRPETSRNGGDYAFHTEQRFYARRNGGKIMYCTLSLHSTSAEFDYCAMTGRFTQTTPTSIWGAEKEIAIMMDGDGSDLILDKVSQPCRYSDAIGATNEEINEAGERIIQDISQDEMRNRRKIIHLL